ncbi:MAG: enoyl-CoA hydratase/isomerase family protein [Notoacmeibacter sp.]|nr:enoyl-CoA hydratase/isomerase family protein [Notoacmeibacter sp.]
MRSGHNVVRFRPCARAGSGTRVDCERTGQRLAITIGGGGRHFLDEGLLGKLEQAIDDVERAQGVSLVILRCTGLSFCEGLDPELVSMSGDGAAPRLASLIERHALLVRRIAGLLPVTLCELGGNAFGSGLELALACDLRIAAGNVRLGFPESCWGVAAGSFAAARAVRLCGPGNAARLLLTGETVDARTAHAMGLVQWTVHVADMEEAAGRLASRICSLSPEALAATKAAMPDCPRVTQPMANHQASILAMPQVRRRVADFLNA